MPARAALPARAMRRFDVVVVPGSVDGPDVLGAPDGLRLMQGRSPNSTTGGGLMGKNNVYWDFGRLYVYGI